MLRERDRGRTPWASERCRFNLLAKKNRYMSNSISMEKPRCPCTAVQRYLTHLPAFRESRFFGYFKSRQRHALTHIPFVTQSTLIRAAAVVLVLGSPTTVWLLRVFLSNFQKVGKFLPCVASVNLPFKRGKSGSGAPNLTLHLLAQSQACTRRRRSVTD